MQRNYNYFGDELKRVFGEKVYKISLDSGFTCPTRDGLKGMGGCYFCGSTGSHFVAKDKPKSIAEQIQEGKKFLSARYKVKKFLAYFQSFTPTYGPIKILEKNLADAISDPDIVGLNLCTRPDCLQDEYLELLARFMLDKYHWLEIGLESGDNEVLNRVGRGHSYEDFEDAYRRAKKLGFRICVHIIIGLPGETREMVLDTCKRLIDLEIDGIKLHNLHIVRNSRFEKEYEKGEIKLVTLEEYASQVSEIVSMLPKSVVIHRLMGDAPKDHLIAPAWCKEKQVALNFIEKSISL
jgi:uncharacterized protein